MYLYSALYVVPHSQGAQAWITQCYLQSHQCLPLPRKCSPDGTSADWGCGHLIAPHFSFIYHERMKGWVGLVGWPTVDGLPTWVVTHQLQVEQGQGKFTGQRPTFYRCAKQPTVSCVLDSLNDKLESTLAPHTSAKTNALNPLNSGCLNQKIQDSNLDFQINRDLRVYRITPKINWIHSRNDASYFTEFREKSAGDCMRNANKCPKTLYSTLAKKWKVNWHLWRDRITTKG